MKNKIPAKDWITTGTVCSAFYTGFAKDLPMQFVSRMQILSLIIRGRRKKQNSADCDAFP